MNPEPSLSKEDFILLQELLLQASGLRFEEDNAQSLLYAIEERRKENRCASYQQYYSLLQSHSEGGFEIRKLLDLITTTETYFFRNSEQFDVLAGAVLPLIIRGKELSGDRSIRVWSAGCSKGNEAYSIAIAIKEAVPVYENWDISILGTDINRQALFYAQESVYNEHDMGHISEEFRDKYFVKEGADYILSDSVKKMVKFEYHNLAKDPFTLEGMRNLDIIFCRNVTIYFDLENTERVIDSFYDCLVPMGWLFLGHAETLWQITNKFESVEFPGTFVYRKSAYPINEEEMRPFINLPEINFDKEQPVRTGEEPGKPSETQERKEELGQLYKDVSMLFDTKDYPGALALIDKMISTDINYVRFYLVKAHILANQGKYEDATGILAKVIEMDPLSAEAHYLLGVISLRKGVLKEAEAEFKKVLYIDPDIIIAYFNLANIHLHQRGLAKARLEFNNAINLLQKKKKGEEIKLGKNFTVEFLLRACKNKLEIISAKERKRERGGGSD